MKRLKWVTLSFALGLSWAPVQAHEIEKPQPFILRSHEPESVLNAVFYAARTQDFAILSVLCDPKGEGDGDTKKLCSVGQPSSDSKFKMMFVKAFSHAKITGKAEYIKGSGMAGAKIPFDFVDPENGKTIHETMDLVQHYGNWYLSSY